jgi:hypothetical protein
LSTPRIDSGTTPACWPNKWIYYEKSIDWADHRQTNFTVTASNVASACGIGRTSRNALLEERWKKWRGIKPEKTQPPWLLSMFKQGKENEMKIALKVCPQCLIPQSQQVVETWTPTLDWRLPILTRASDTTPEWACTPDAIDFCTRTGYEFKTKIKAALPSGVHDIVMDEYLQCQFGLYCCSADIDTWQLWTNKIDTDDYRGFLINPDTDLLVTHIFPIISEFSERVKADTLVPYNRMNKDDVFKLTSIVRQSMYSHVLDLQSNVD